MAVLVPFDGSVLAKSALFHGGRAAELDGTPLLAATVIPVNNTEYADKKGWITSDEEFDKKRIISRLRQQVEDCVSSAIFEHFSVGRYASSGTMANRLRRVARNRDVTSIFIGSDAAGQALLGTESVGGRVLFEKDCDVAIIRNPVSNLEVDA
ncbi:universal stress protein [Halosegnis longus]|uniref:universal stress protein n=1 Tax=Halosegnis longus TaxID=2216012 RepID=UPI00096AB004|nr:MULTISPECIES: universal stress protein [Halobacteriales]